MMINDEAKTNWQVFYNDCTEWMQENTVWVDVREEVTQGGKTDKLTSISKEYKAGTVTFPPEHELTDRWDWLSNLNTFLIPTKMCIFIWDSMLKARMESSSSSLLIWRFLME